MPFQIRKWDLKLKKDWDIHWYEGIPLDVCIHDMCESQQENKKKEEKKSRKTQKEKEKEMKRWRT